MFKRVKPTPKQIKETSLRSNGVKSMTYVYDILTKVRESGLTVADHMVMSWLYTNYTGNIKMFKEVFGLSMLGSFKIVHKLIDLEYIERVNAYSVILTSKGVLYIESFI